MGLQHLLMGSANIVITLIVAPLGVIAIAANSFAITVESLCYMPGFGVSEAATTLVGQCLGASQKKLTRSFAHLAVKMGMITMTIMGLLMWVFARELMQVMSPVQDIITLGAQVLRIEAWAEPMFAAAIVCNGIFHTLGAPGAHLWTARCVDCHVHRALFPRLNLPVASCLRSMAQQV